MSIKTIELAIDETPPTPADYVRNSKREAWKVLRCLYRVEQPTERQVTAYILFGDKAPNGSRLFQGTKNPE